MLPGYLIPNSYKRTKRLPKATRANGCVVGQAAPPIQNSELLKSRSEQSQASSEFMLTMLWNCSKISRRCCAMNRLTASFASNLLR